MRVLVVSDIHANLTALETVLEDARGDWDQLWCLGDVVGYGPDPNECASLLRELEPVSLSGNHDWAVLGKLEIASFNDEAQTAIRWTQEQLSSENRDYLDSLPATLDLPPHFTLAHASPRQPVWEYILEPNAAFANFHFFDTPFCLVGHSHVPLIFGLDGNTVFSRPPLYRHPIELDPAGRRLILNPGSVGQPRDSDPRAAYALLDLEGWTWEHRRVDYDIAATQERMRAHALPERLIARLEYGW